MHREHSHEATYTYGEFHKRSKRQTQAAQGIHDQRELTYTNRQPVQIFTARDLGSQFAYELLIQRGELRELLPGYSCADAEPDSLHLRLALARAVVKDEGVLALESALWLYQGGSVPTKLAVYHLPYEKRPQSKVLRGLRKRFYPGDVLTLEGVRVMKPANTQRELGLDQEILAPVIR